MTTVAPSTDRLPADPSLITLLYQHEHLVQGFEFDETLEVWKVNARIDADVLAEELSATTDMDQEALDAVEDLAVGRMSFVRVRMFGPFSELGADPLSGMGLRPRLGCPIVQIR